MNRRDCRHRIAVEALETRLVLSGIHSGQCDRHLDGNGLAAA